MTTYMSISAGGLMLPLAVQEAGEIIAPAEYPVPAYAPPVGGTTWYAYVAGEAAPYNNATHTLQYCLTNCVGGDVVTLKAGSKYSAPNGGYFILPSKTPSANWIYIISSDVAGLPAEGTRVTPADVNHMATIEASGTPSEGSLGGCLSVSLGVAKVRIVGLELSTAYDVRTNVQYSLFKTGYDGSGSDPSDIVLERCYVHGTTTGNNRYGILLGRCANVAIKECYISEIHCLPVYDEAIGIQIYRSTGPVLVHNNYVAAAGINVFLGDSYPPASVVDVTCTRNHLFKSKTWDPADASYAGIPWFVKNLWETKGVLRCLVEGNVLENCWIGGQHGQGFLIKTNCTDVEDLTIRNNFIKNVDAPLGLSVQGIGGVGTPLYMKRISVSNNLCIGAVCGTQRLAAPGVGRMEDMRIYHNTFLATGTGATWIYVESTVADHFDSTTIVSNNIGMFGSYGFYADTGLQGINAYNGRWTTSAVQNNVLVLNGTGTPGSVYGTSGLFGPFYFPDEIANVGFVDGAGTDVEDYALTGVSTYHNAGTDGTDIGIDATVLAAAIAGVV